MSHKNNFLGQQSWVHKVLSKMFESLSQSQSIQKKILFGAANFDKD